MDKLFHTTIIDVENLFDDYFLKAKMIYVRHFDQLPELLYVGNVDDEKALKALKEKHGHRIVRIYKYQRYDKRGKDYIHDTAVVLLTDAVIEFNTGYCEIWHSEKETKNLDEIVSLLGSFSQRGRRKPLEINIVVQGRQGLYLKPMEIKRTKLDIALYYGEEFRETDALIRQRLGKNKSKGIVLLHGLPGTGKTTYLRYLIGSLKKRIMFVPPAVARNLANPDFIELLINNSNAVLIIEDAENVIMDRKHSPGSSVSNLLNISDGLMADFLNIQLICTFNNSLTLIDEALMRKGRLIAKHEFGKLSVARSQRLSDHLGFKTTITRPMTIAEITNPHEKQQEAPRMEVIGFRRHLTDTTQSLV